MSDIRSLFMLRDDVAFLNHGSFGACPQQVFDRYVQILRQAEAQPVEFIARESPELYRQARQITGQYLNAHQDDLVFVSNATVGVNIVAKSLKLRPGDEILTTDHEYGACDRTWDMVCQATGATYRHVPIPVPVTTHQDFLDTFLPQISPATRVIFISHITSPTALTFPVAEVCRHARERGIITLVDGAHGPGQIPLDMQQIDADFYTGNFHKWLCTPKGTAFLYARREMQPTLQPLVVSWGNLMWTNGSDFIDEHQYRGTRDVAAPLTIPDAIAFQQEHDWDAVRQACHELILRARPLIASALNATPAAPEGAGWFRQMSSFILPPDIDGAKLQSLLYQRYTVEIPTMPWNGHEMIRIAVQGYNTWQDIERLLDGLNALAPECRRSS